MLRWMLLICGPLLLTTACNCSRDHRSGVQVVVEGSAPFPAVLAGQWKDDHAGWEFTLAPDGSLSSAVISLGGVRVAPGRITKMLTKTGKEAIFSPGPWTVQYVPSTRALTIRITMEHVRVDMGGNLLEGSSTDVFTGPVSPAGDTWQVEWTTFTRYTAHTPENTSFDLSTDPTYGETQPLTFKKAAGRR